MSINLDRDKDIEIIFRTNVGTGYGYAYENEAGYSSLVFESRLNQEMIDNNKTHEDITEEITNSKAYSSQHNNEMDAINNILEFYFQDSIKEIPNVPKVYTLQKAIEMLENQKEKFLIFQMRDDKRIDVLHSSIGEDSETDKILEDTINLISTLNNWDIDSFKFNDIREWRDHLQWQAKLMDDYINRNMEDDCMTIVDLETITNEKVLASEIDDEFETICGTNLGILWEDSLEQFFIANNIEIVAFKESGWIELQQGETTKRFQMFLGREASDQARDHIDFNMHIV